MSAQEEQVPTEAKKTSVMDVLTYIVIGFIALGAVARGYEWVAGQSSAEEPAQVADQHAGEAPPPAPRAEPQQSGPTRAFYYLQQGAPLCGDIRGMYAADTVLRSGNDYAMQAVMDRYGCEMSSETVEFDSNNTVVRTVGDRFVAITGSRMNGVTVLTSADFMTTEYHNRPRMGHSP